MEYLVNGKKYSYSYRALREQYKEICEMTDERFMKELKDITHFACFVSYIKELNIEDTLSDEGIIHQLVHLLTIDDPVINLQSIRELFKTTLLLS